MNNIVDLNSFAGGALAEKFNVAFKQVMENIMDTNTEAGKKRKLILELTVEGNEDRDLTYVAIKTKVKLEQPKQAVTTVVIGKDPNGEVLASEYKKQVPGQIITTVNNETGEVGTTAEEKNNLEGIKLVK